MAFTNIRQRLEERLLQEMESARMEYNCVSQEFLLFMAGNASRSFVATNEDRFSQLMAQHSAALERYSSALQRVHSSVSTNKGTEMDFGTFLPNHEYWLTNRERQVLFLLIAGRSTKQVATDIGISFKTVASHRHHIMMKMDVHETASMVRKALFAGLGWESVRLRSSSTASSITQGAQGELASDYSLAGLLDTSEKQSAKGDAH